MHIPGRKREQFVRQTIDDCLSSQQDRTQRGAYYRNYALLGAENSNVPALYNKTYAYLDDLESLLYSPISLRFHIGDPDYPNLLTQAKGRAAANRLRNQARRSNTDTTLSEAVFWSLVKGKAILKQNWKRAGFYPTLVQPENFGVMHENHDRLDEDMEAFVHSMLITPYQFERLIAKSPERDALRKKGQNYVRDMGNSIYSADTAAKQVVVGGMYPFQPAGGTNPNTSRGIVDWMGGPSPQVSDRVRSTFMQMDELWVWDDERDGWATFLMIGNDMLIWGKDFTANAMAWNSSSLTEIPELKRNHPFGEVCPNRMADYFWGRSEIVNVALLQEAINSRINGINHMLRKQEDPPTYFKGSSGVNQLALSRFNKPGGFWNDASPAADMKKIDTPVNQDLWRSLHEYERMFDEMGGLPPIAKGHGEAGVRSAGHAETLVRMFSPRFKDRALLVERDVEGVGALMLDLSRVHDPKRMIAWIDQASAGMESVKPDPLIVPPAEGLVAVPFTFDDLDDDVTLSIDSHSSSPAFSQEAKSLAFDLLKIGAYDAGDVAEHVDIADPSEAQAGIMRRRVAAAKAQQQDQQLKLISHGGRK